MYLFAIGSVSCLIPRLLDGGLGIRRCVSYVNAIIPCDCLVFLERQCHPVASALTASALASLSLEDHGSEEEEEERPKAVISCVQVREVAFSALCFSMCSW